MKNIAKLFGLIIITFIFILIKPIIVNTINSTSPVIYYIPHADDEAIGLSAAITKDRSAGRLIYIVLISSEHNQGLLDMMNGKALSSLAGKSWCHFHPKYHNFHMSPDQLDEARNREFIASSKILGAHQIIIGNNGQTIPDALFYKNYDEAVRQVKEIIKNFETLHPRASHKLVSGARDAFFDGQNWVVNKTHKALYDAAVQFNKENPEVTDITFYRVYVFRDPEGNQKYNMSDYIYRNDSKSQKAKRKSLKVYMDYDPKKGKYALGYHSFPDLIDKSYDSEFTYVDFLPSDKVEINSE